MLSETKRLLILPHLRSPDALIGDVVLANLNNFGLYSQDALGLSIVFGVFLINRVAYPCVSILCIIEADHS